MPIPRVAMPRRERQRNDRPLHRRRTRRAGPHHRARPGPRPPLPEIPELDDPSFKKIYGEYNWPVNYERATENAMDPSHAAFVHGNRFGDRTLGGLIARDQMVGPWQVPVADCAVTAATFDVYTGEQVGAGKKSLAFRLRFRAALEPDEQDAHVGRRHAGNARGLADGLRLREVQLLLNLLG